MTYDLFLACEKGTAKYVVSELTLRNFSANRTVSDTAVVVHDCSITDLIRAAYTLQTPSRIGMLLGSTTVSLDTEETVVSLATLIGTFDFKEVLPKGLSFAVVCERDGNHEYNSIDVAQEAPAIAMIRL